MSDEFKENSNIKPNLTFETLKEEVITEINQKDNRGNIVDNLDDTALTKEEKKIVDDFVDKIDINNSNGILQYGVSAQKKIADFSETALNSVKTKDLGQIGDMLSNIVGELKNFEDSNEKKGLLGFFKKNTNKITRLKAKYEKVDENINKICNSLESHQIQLLKDIAMLDKMYDINTTSYKELSMYILAGKKKLIKLENEEMPNLLDKAKLSGLPEDAQKVNDFSSLCNRFEKKIHDLELTKMVSLQMAPQIRLIQNNDSLMSEKIQSTIVNTIPLWKSQIVLALGLNHSNNAVKLQNEVTNMTNELLKKNGEMLKMSTINTARESERGIVDIDTLKKTNEDLISTLDEIMKIQLEGRQKRKDAETELQSIEEKLKNKLLALKN